MTRKCNIPPSPFVPYWIVAQREDTDVSALQGLIDIAEEDDGEGDETDEAIKEYEEYGVDDFDDDDDFDEDEDFDDENDEEGEDAEYDNENYDDFIDEKF